MPDIDIDKIKPGDTVRVRYCDSIMLEHGIEPIDLPPTQAYRAGQVVYAAAWAVHNPSVTILWHIPARPDWADALVVRDKDGDHWGRVRDCWFLLGAESDEDTYPRGTVAQQGPITVVLDADGNPPTAEHEWLDADALDKLPLGAVVVPQFASRSAVRGSYWHMPQSDRADKMHTSAELAPARVLWTPEADR